MDQRKNTLNSCNKLLIFLLNDSIAVFLWFLVLR